MASVGRVVSLGRKWRGNLALISYRTVGLNRRIHSERSGTSDVVNFFPLSFPPGRRGQGHACSVQLLQKAWEDFDRELHVDQPLQTWPLTRSCEASHDTKVLSEECLQAVISHPTAHSFLDSLSCSGEVALLLAHPLVHRIHDTLLAEGFPDIVLSLSGGVDSMSHLVLLWAVLQRESSFQLAALHIRSAGRDGGLAQSEEDSRAAWIGYTCDRLGVPLYVYELPKHIQSSMSHEDFEEATMHARFRMYRRVASQVGFVHGRWCAMLAHHADDVDENRLVGLSRGKRFALDGMRQISSKLGVTILRPLLKVRKAEIKSFANMLPLCYFHDVKPCLREWIRCAMHGVCLDKESRRQLLLLLNDAGKLSGEIDDELRLAVHKFSACHVIPARRLHLNGDGKRELTCDVWTVAINLQPLRTLSCLNSLSRKLDRLEDVIQGIAAIWNPVVATFCSSATAMSSFGPSQLTTRKSLPRQCPLRAIPSCKEQDSDMGVFSLREVLRVVASDPCSYPVFDGSLPTDRAVLHLWTHMKRTRMRTDRNRESFASGFLSESVHYVYSSSDDSLLLLAADGLLAGQPVFSSRNRGRRQKLAPIVRQYARA
eukprot:TRINITY_DN74576_c0_g1_i1.p1 TRINITY_DN74576_c0_g1~~TRINITY_DN74576_c0_g1_i1.p1  ORF type:complete len:599 (-),score=58.24 TRINITY_DN74576_c0_g1_i1:149-1945(-)